MTTPKLPIPAKLITEPPTGTIWVIQRVDFDPMENHIAAAVTTSFVGYTKSEADTVEVMNKLMSKEKDYEGWDHARYPYFTATATHELTGDV